jgi:hypothetical protein
MSKPYLASLLSAFALLGISGCSAQSLPTGKPGPVLDASTRSFDASTRLFDATPNDASFDYTPVDATDCGCRIGSDGVMRMSWACFCSSFGCGNPWLGWCGSPGQWTSGCGLDVFTYDELGLLQIYTYDRTGTQVGTQLQNSDVAFVCPSDWTLTSLTIAAGMFPDAACPTVVCPCDSADRAFTCPAPGLGISLDAGTQDAASLSF